MICCPMSAECGNCLVTCMVVFLFFSKRGKISICTALRLQVHLTLIETELMAPSHCDIKFILM